MIGWITTWGIKCGIATYSRFLIEQMDDEVVVLCQSGEGEVEGQSLVGRETQSSSVELLLKSLQRE